MVGLIFAALAYICQYFGSDKVAAANKYTKFQMNLNVNCFIFISGHIGTCCFLAFKGMLPKPLNNCLRWITDSILFIITAGIVFCWAYFIAYKAAFMGLCIPGYDAVSVNWWASPKDSFITNASYLNAALSWPVWLFSWILWFMIFILGLYGLIMIIGIFFIITDFKGRRSRFID
jgi:hypothetical protein